MPPRDNIGLRLSRAHENQLIIRVTCNFCRTVRHYLPEDMRALLGDVEVDGLRRRLRCESCDKRDYVEVEGKFLYPNERSGLIVRRLVRVRTIRRPVWQDEKL